MPTPSDPVTREGPDVLAAPEGTEHQHHWETWDIEEDGRRWSRVVCADHRPPLLANAGLIEATLRPIPSLDADEWESISLALGTFPTWFPEIKAKVDAIRAALALRAGGPK